MNPLGKPSPPWSGAQSTPCRAAQGPQPARSPSRPVPPRSPNPVAQPMPPHPVPRAAAFIDAAGRQRSAAIRASFSFHTLRLPPPGLIPSIADLPRLSHGPLPGPREPLTVVVSFPPKTPSRLIALLGRRWAPCRLQLRDSATLRLCGTKTRETYASASERHGGHTRDVYTSGPLWSEPSSAARPGLRKGRRPRPSAPANVCGR